MPLPMGNVSTAARDGEDSRVDGGANSNVPGADEGVIPGRTIRFHDEQQKAKIAED